MDPRINDEETPKKPYEKPQIVYQCPLEAMASDCSTGGKSNPVECGAILQS